MSDTEQAMENFKSNVFEFHNLLSRDYAFLPNADIPEQYKDFLSRAQEYSEYFKGAFVELRQDRNSIHLKHLGRACKEFMQELDANTKQLKDWPPAKQNIFKNQINRLLSELKSTTFNISVAHKIMHSEHNARQTHANETLLVVEHQLLAMDQLIKKHSYLWDSPHTPENLKNALNMVPYFVNNQMAALKSRDLDKLVMFAEKFLNGLNVAISNFPSNLSDELPDQRRKEAYQLFHHLKGRASFLIKAANTAKFKS